MISSFEQCKCFNVKITVILTMITMETGHLSSLEVAKSAHKLGVFYENNM